MDKILCAILYLLVIFIEIQACPKGWQYWSKSCYLVSNKRLRYKAALEYCRKRKSSLVNIQSAEENGFIYDLVRGTRYDRYYIGAVRKDDGKNHFVTSGGQELEYTNWGKGEPNDQFWMEDCVETRKTIWNDIPCRLRLPFVCESKVKCEKNTCQNGGKCVELPEKSPIPFKCECKDPFFGKLCEKRFEGCPKSWIPHDNHCYQLQKGARPWSNARAACQRIGGDLPEVQSKDENAFLHKMFNKADLWIGVIDCLWGLKCSTDYGGLKYKNWAAGEPKNLGDDVRGCGTIRKANGKWYNKNCKENYVFVCKREAPVFSALPAK